MECNCCGRKMVKAKYLHLDELEDFLKVEYTLPRIQNYAEWLNTLNENDLVITLFQRKSFNGLKKKYYLRLVEKRMKTGIKLKRLSKTFKYETGELIYGKPDDILSIMTTYKILPITEDVDKIIRRYCKNGEKFDIDNLNEIISKNLLF